MPKIVREIQDSEADEVGKWLPLWESVIGQQKLCELFETEFRPKISGILAEW